MGEPVEVHFREKVSGRNLYCRFVLQVDLIQGSTDFHLISEDHIDEFYKPAIDFAFDCFKGEFSVKYPAYAAKVTILRMGELPVDTTKGITFYVMLTALCKAADITIIGFGLGLEQGLITLPVRI